MVNNHTTIETQALLLRKGLSPYSNYYYPEYILEQIKETINSKLIYLTLNQPNNEIETNLTHVIGFVDNATYLNEELRVDVHITSSPERINLIRDINNSRPNIHYGVKGAGDFTIEVIDGGKVIGSYDLLSVGIYLK